MNKNYIATIGSVTTAIKAEKMLAEHSIQVRIIKLDPAYTEKGCAYGIEFSSSNKSAVEKLLKIRGIEHKLLTH